MDRSSPLAASADLADEPHKEPPALVRCEPLAMMVDTILSPQFERRKLRGDGQWLTDEEHARCKAERMSASHTGRPRKSLRGRDAG